MNKWRIVLIMLPFLAFLYVTAIEVAVDEFQNVPTDGISFENFQGVVTGSNTVAEIRGIGRTLAQIRTTEGQRYALGTKYSITVVSNDENDGLFAAAIIQIDEDALVEHIRNVRLIVAGFLEEEYGYTAEQADTLAYFLSFYNALHRGDLEFFKARYKPEILNLVDADNVGISTIYTEWAGRTRFIIPLIDVADIILSEMGSEVIDLAVNTDGEDSMSARENLQEIKIDAVDNAQQILDSNEQSISENEQNIANLEIQKAQLELDKATQEQERDSLLVEKRGLIISTPDGSIFVIIRRPITLDNDNSIIETEVDEVVVREVDVQDLPADYDANSKTEVSIQRYSTTESGSHVQDVLVDDAVVEEYIDEIDGEIKHRLILVVTTETVQEQTEELPLSFDETLIKPETSTDSSFDLSAEQQAIMDRLHAEIIVLEKEIAELETQINDLKASTDRLVADNAQIAAEQDRLVEQIKQESEQLEKDKTELEQKPANDIIYASAVESNPTSQADVKAQEEAPFVREVAEAEVAQARAEADVKAKEAAAAKAALAKAEADAEEARLMNEGRVPVVGDLIFFMNSKAGTRNGHRRNEIISLNMLDLSIMNRSADNVCSAAFVAFAGGVVAITEEGGRPESPHRLTLFDLSTLTPKAASTVEIHWESFIYMAEGRLYAMAKDAITGNFVLARFNDDMSVEKQSEAIVDPQTSITVNRNHIFVRTKDMKHVIVLNKVDLTTVGEVIL